MTRVLVLLIALLPVSAWAQTIDRAEVETIVREYLLANPEVLEEAFTALQTRRQAEADEERAAQLVTYREALVASPHGAVLGNPEGDVTVVEFFDYNCGFCKRAMEDMDKLLEADPNLRVVLKEFPVLGQPSMEAAAVSIMVYNKAPEKFGEFHRQLLSHEGRADKAVALEIAASLDLPVDALEEAMRSDDVRAAVEESYMIAEALGLTGTPSYVIGDKVEFGAVGYDALKAAVNEARCGEVSC